MPEELRICDIEVGKRHRRDLGDIAKLAKSIREVGLLQPLVVTGDRLLIAGLRRLEAVKELGWSSVPVRTVNIRNILRGERDENACRKDFTPSEAVAIGRAIEAEEKVFARERQREHAETAPGKPKNTLGKLPEVIGTTGRVRDTVAAAVGMSGSTYEHAKAVVEAAEEDSSLQPLVDEMDRTGKVDPVFQAYQGSCEDLAGEEVDERWLSTIQQLETLVESFRKNDGLVSQVAKWPLKKKQQAAHKLRHLKNMLETWLLRLE